MELDSVLLFLFAIEPIREPFVPLWVLEWGMNVFLSAWLFWVGACVGSFLNVVVYRLPRGKNLAHPPSFCPRCHCPIRLRDNIPIASWLLLRGRCRDCSSPIPARYFLVELTVAALFLGVALVEWKLGSGLWVAPGERSRRLYSPYDVVPFWISYALHVLLITTLLGAALIDASGQRTPRRMFAPIVLAGLLAGLVWPELRRLPAWGYSAIQPWQAGLIDGLAGFAAGAAIGALIAVAWWRGSRRAWPRFAVTSLFAALGAVAGWQMALEGAAAAALLWLAAIWWQRVSESHGIAPLAGFVLVFAIPRLTALDVRLGMPIVWPERYVAAIAIGLIASASLGAWLAGRLAPSHYFDPPPEDPPTVTPPQATHNGETDPASLADANTEPINGEAAKQDTSSAKEIERESPSGT